MGAAYARCLENARGVRQKIIFTSPLTIGADYAHDGFIESMEQMKMTQQEYDRELSSAYAALAVKGLDPVPFAKAWKEAKENLSSKMAVQS